jgi:hypothetical protein
MTPDVIIRTVYLSTAVGVLRADELDRIWLRAKASNAGAGVTGLMLFHQGVFLQVLEGPAAGVASLMERIHRDRRHSGIVVLESGEVAERAFAGSPMHYIAARNLSVGEKQALADLRTAVTARPMMFGPPAPGADNGLGAFLSAFKSLRPV